MRSWLTWPFVVQHSLDHVLFFPREQNGMSKHSGIPLACEGKMAIRGRKKGRRKRSAKEREDRGCRKRGKNAKREWEKEKERERERERKRERETWTVTLCAHLLSSSLSSHVIASHKVTGNRNERENKFPEKKETKCRCIIDTWWEKKGGNLDWSKVLIFLPQHFFLSQSDFFFGIQLSDEPLIAS